MISERRLGALAIAVLIAVVVLGCGSRKAGEGHGHGTRSSEKSEERGAPRLPPADRRAYLEVASDSGTLRVSTVRAALGQSSAIDTKPIAAAQKRLMMLRPRDPGLARLKEQLIAACSRVLAHSRSPSGVRRSAREALAATDAVNAGLRQYAARQPAVAGLIPD